MIMERLRVLGLEETKLVSKAVRKHLEELDDVAAYDEAKAQPEEGEVLESVVKRFSPPAAS